MLNTQFSPLCFGKLPTFGDFVRFNAAGKEILFLDEWFQKGLLFAKNRLHPNWDLAYKKAPNYFFIFPSDENNRCITCVFYPSRDKIGRKYPFFAGMSVEFTVLHEKPFFHLPALFQPLREQASQYALKAVQGQLSEIIPADVEDLGHDLEQSFEISMGNYDNFKMNTTLGQHVTQTWNDFNNPAKKVVYENLISLVKSLKKQDVSRLAYGLRIPLGWQTPVNVYMVSFWLELIAKMLPQYLNIPYLFFANDNPMKPAYLFIYFNHPSANNFASLIQVDLEIDSVYKLDSPSSSGSPGTENNMDTQLNAIMDNSNQNLADFKKSLIEIVNIV
jgi:type VI secretion system ImpM family protein